MRELDYHSPPSSRPNPRARLARFLTVASFAALLPSLCAFLLGIVFDVVKRSWMTAYDFDRFAQFTPHFCVAGAFAAAYSIFGGQRWGWLALALHAVAFVLLPSLGHA